MALSLDHNVAILKPILSTLGPNPEGGQYPFCKSYYQPAFSTGSGRDAPRLGPDESSGTPTLGTLVPLRPIP